MDIIFKLLKVSLSLIYPIILILLFLYIYKNNNYNQIINDKYKTIIRNTIIVSIIFTIGFIIFFIFEDTIYRFDYAGAWSRNLELRNNYTNPLELLKYVYQTMLNNDYTSLSSLFQLGATFVSTSYGFLAYSTFIYYYLPIFILLQVLYFKYYNRYDYLPIIISIMFYPLYISIFFGIIDISGLLFFIISIMLVIIPKFKDISNKDYLLINILVFIMIFLRRWYLYPVLGLYICIFIKYLYYYKFKINKESIKDLFRIISSGIILLLVLILFFRPYLERLLLNDFSSAYNYYDRGHKILGLINFYSILYCLVCVHGISKLIINKLYCNITNILLVIIVLIPLLLFWNIQNLEFHHYYMISFSILVLFTYGLYNIFSLNNKLKYLIMGLSIIQLCFIFSPYPNDTRLITTVRKFPERLEYKSDVVDISTYLNNVGGEWVYGYVATGNYSFNDDILKNATLPYKNNMKYVYATLDDRDNFPADFEAIKYVVISDPIMYLQEPKYQQMYKVITDAIVNNELFKDYYNKVYTKPLTYKSYNPIKVHNTNIMIYERTKDLTQDHLDYLYDEMIKLYPNNKDKYHHINN